MGIDTDLALSRSGERRARGRRLWRPHFAFGRRAARLADGAAHFRKVAARLIQRFPEVVEPLREGKLCITSIVELARVMTPENREETLPRFFHMSKRQAKAVAAAILPAAVIPRREVVTVVRPEVLRAELRPDETPPSHAAGEAARALPMRVEPLTATESRIHLTVWNQFLEKLEAARRGQGHVQPGATREQVIEAALDLLLEKQASRRAEVKRPQKNPRPAKLDHVTAAVKRARSTATPTWISSPVEYPTPPSRWRSGGRGGRQTPMTTMLSLLASHFPGHCLHSHKRLSNPRRGTENAMTTRNQKSIRFNVSRSHGWNDLFVVASLAIVLGAFVAQISSTPKHSSGSLPMAAVSATASQSG